MAHFVAYFVFDPSVKFEFKTQCFVIDGIDGILSPIKWKKVANGSMDMGGIYREKYFSWEIYAIYAIYATTDTVFRNGK